jgi:hypothetical protein
MIQQTRHRYSRHGEMAWLSALTKAMHEVARPEVRAMPCDAALLAAVRAHLARPATRCWLYGSKFSFRN